MVTSKAPGGRQPFTTGTATLPRDRLMLKTSPRKRCSTRSGCPSEWATNRSRVRRIGSRSPVAVVTTEPGAQVDLEAVQARCRSDLAAYKVPRRVVVVDELPRSQIGKVLRREVRERLLAG